MKSIFIAMPAMDDSELIPTIRDAYEKAKHPERVFFGVAVLWSRKSYLSEFLKGTEPWEDRVSFVEQRITAKNIWQTFGVGRGRKMASDLYNDQDYMLQCDSHTLFAENWDDQLIKLHNKAKRTLKLPKIILTGYAGHYSYVDGKRIPTTDGGRIRFPFMVEAARFSSIIPNWLDFPLPEDIKQPFFPCIKFNANFSFGDKAFAENTGVYEEAVFFEEELLQTLALTKAGFNLVFPHLKKHLICHLYSGHINDFGGYRTGLGHYVPPVNVKYMDAKTNTNYRSFLDDPANWPVIKKWERYAKTSLRYGVLRQNHIPEHYLNEPDSSLKS